MQITYKQGDTIRHYVKLAYKGTGEPVNLEGCTAKSQMRKNKELVAEGAIAIDTANGLVSATYTPQQTKVLEPGNYSFDIRMQSQGDVITLCTKQIKIIEPETEME